jgi:uncharacterized Zn-finger protein
MSARFRQTLLCRGTKGEAMANSSVPHFHNSEGLRQIEVGSKEFQCIGALPPFDHPHIYLDMGKDNEIVCSYCSTHYVYNSNLIPGTSSPLSAVYNDSAD